MNSDEMEDSGQDDGCSEVEDGAARMFKVWFLGSELEWAREAWGHLHAAGLEGGDTLLEVTAGKLRLVALALIYEEFSGLAWNENNETPLDYLAEGLEIDPRRTRDPRCCGESGVASGCGGRIRFAGRLIVRGHGSHAS